jgi:hypothetical protein
MKKYKHIIAIDPDVTKSGVAYLNAETRALECSSKTFPQLMDYLQYLKMELEASEMLAGFAKPKDENTVIIVEAGWLNKSNWHVRTSDNKRIAAAKGNATGRNHEVGRKIVEVAKHWGFDVVEQPPLRKCWKGADGKITHEELAYFTNIMGRTSQDMRDAALIAWNFANLPIKIKCK